MIHIYDTCNVPGLRQGATLRGRWLHLRAATRPAWGIEGRAGDVKNGTVDMMDMWIWVTG